MTLDATYVHCKVASILHKIGIYNGWMGQIVSPIVCPNWYKLGKLQSYAKFFCYVKVSHGK
jgi:hypothetical protein